MTSLRTLFLHPPSFEGFDGGAGSRYQARREVRSFWYPTWLAQPAALVPGSRLVDAPPAGLTVDDVVALAPDYELAVLHTSTPSFAGDLRVAEAMWAANPRLRIGLVGAHVAVHREAALAASPAVEFVTGTDFDFTIKEVAEGRPLGTVWGLSYREGERLRRTPERPPLEDMDALPFVVDVYRRDLVVEHYFIGYLLHPYVSLYTGRGCRSRCTFCLWPQTVGGHRYRTRSVDHVVAEIARAVRHFPQVREYFFDDDTFTDDLPRAEAIARGLGRLGVTWSCNAKANVPRASLEIFADHGLRLLVVGYESGSQAILNTVRKGIRLDGAREFTRNAQSLGIRSTERSSSVCPARPARPSGGRSTSPGRSIPTRCRSRWPRRTRGPSCTARRSRRAGSRAASWWMAPAYSSARWATPIFRAARSSPRWRRSTGASTSGRARSWRWGRR